MIITKQLYKYTFKILLFVSFYSAAQELTTSKEEILLEIEKSSDTFKDIANNIWELAELGFLEEKSSTLLRKV
jgi:aminobenzoyl-glutamate utilization protein B